MVGVIDAKEDEERARRSTKESSSAREKAGENKDDRAEEMCGR
jgi:hypothetical protein